MKAFENIMNKVYTLSFPEARNVVVSGDIHGDFNLLVYKLCVQYQMKDTVLIVAGDCGFGFLMACKHTILCVGGGISIDRRYRMEEWKKYCAKNRMSPNTEDKFGKNFYWSDEPPVYNDEMITLLRIGIMAIFISHGIPLLKECCSKCLI